MGDQKLSIDLSVRLPISVYRHYKHERAVLDAWPGVSVRPGDDTVVVSYSADMSALHRVTNNLNNIAVPLADIRTTVETGDLTALRSAWWACTNAAEALDRIIRLLIIHQSRGPK